MKKAIFLLAFLASALFTMAQTTFPRPDVCPACVEDTTGGYISIADTISLNPVCNFELLTQAHLSCKKESRDTISFFPSDIDRLYKNSGNSRGHVIPFEDLAYSARSAKASMNLKRNLAPQPQNENIGTKLACENHTRDLAAQYGTVKVYGGTFGTLGQIKGINAPACYWTVIVTPIAWECYLMPTTGDKIGYEFLNDPDIKMSYADLIHIIRLDPLKAIKK